MSGRPYWSQAEYDDLGDSLDAVVAELDEVKAQRDALQAQVNTHAAMPRLLAAIEAVLAVHRPRDDGWHPDQCAECPEPYPCDTVQAINDALGGSD